MEITKAQAVTLLAQVYDRQRTEGETDVALVQRIRNGLRARELSRIDERLKSQAIAEYYKSNPGSQETVADLD